MSYNTPLKSNCYKELKLLLKINVKLRTKRDQRLITIPDSFYTEREVQMVTGCTVSQFTAA